jgi:hypothetical protein
MADAGEWYYSVGGQRSGPVTGADLKQLAQAGRLGPDDLVWKDGMAEWQPASKLKGLFPPPAPRPGPPELPVSDGPPPITTRRAAPSGPLGNLSDPLRSAVWVKAVSGAGLLLVFVGLVCPWYSYASSASVDVSGLNGMPGMGGGKRPGQSVKGGGFGYSDDGMGRTSASASATVSGISTVPGVLALLGFLAAAGLSFVPKRWAAVGAAGAGGLVLLAVAVSLVYAPSVKEEQSVGGPGMGASSKTDVSSSWGQFVTALGGLPVIAGPVLGLVGVGAAGVGGRGGRPGYRQPAAAADDAPPLDLG